MESLMTRVRNAEPRIRSLGSSRSFLFPAVQKMWRKAEMTADVYMLLHDKFARKQVGAFPLSLNEYDLSPGL